MHHTYLKYSGFQVINYLNYDHNRGAIVLCFSYIARHSIIFDLSLAHALSNPFRKSYWFYRQNITRIWSLPITCTSCLNYCNGLLTASALPLFSLFSAQKPEEFCWNLIWINKYLLIEWINGFSLLGIFYLVVVVFPSIFWLFQIFTVPSFEHVAKSECSSETLIRFTADLCSWRCATRSPLGRHPKKKQRSVS